jgi:excisionase family DNA binding protein
MQPTKKDLDNFANLLTKEQAAVRIGKSCETLERLVRLDKVPMVKFGRRCVRFRPSDLDGVAT